MNGRVLFFGIVVQFFRESVCVNVEENSWDLGSGIDYVEDVEIANGRPEALNSTFYKSVKRYHCFIDTSDYIRSSELRDSEPHQVVYGTKTWRFPAQDVNLTLGYPMMPGTSDYMLTSMEVILYTDGVESRGYITAGGLQEDHISMSFILRNITRLAYQFWLHGLPKRKLYQGLVTSTNLCRSRG